MKDARPIAVALKADGWSRHSTGLVPKITAIGHGKNAEQILSLAFANDVKVRKDADLASILASMDIESPVPLEALSAVSEILSYLYHLDRTTVDAALASDVSPNISPDIS
nr:EscU/YscU/HrcU family type III secretion system export apparatus switch protein [Govania unica]